jgi:energy-coupling factor transporter ATP-binding protein EcfA2
MAAQFPPEDKTYPYCLELELRGLRPFLQSASVSFSKQANDDKAARWTIIVGDNGTGKTTILQCIAVFPWRTSLVGWLRSHKNPMAHGGRMLRLADSNDATLYFFAYGASRRINGMPQLEFEASGGFETLFSELVGLPDPSRRLLDWHIARNLKDSSEEERAQAKARYEQVVALLVGLLPDVVDVQLKAVGGRPAVMFKTDFGEVTIEQLSAGYRAMAAWVVDLASHMFNAYPESADPLSEPAVVLVDEFDLHLHPKWQREAIGFLTERFPAVQFIVTAHSPLVAQSAPDANIVVLRKSGDHVEILNHVSLSELDAMLVEELSQDDSGAPKTRAR